MTKSHPAARRTLALLLSFALLLTALPAVGFAAFADGTGLVFRSNGNGTCDVTGIGTCTDADLVIPSQSPAGDTVTAIAFDAFSGCDSLVSVTTPETVTIIRDWAFVGCSALQRVTILGDVTYISDSAFDGCASLEAIDIPMGGSAYDSVDGVLFDADMTALIRCPEGKSGDYTIPSTVCMIHEYAFYDCALLTGVTIPDGIGQIAEGVFFGCSSLTSVTLPDTVGHIGEWAFFDCSSLADVYFLGTQGQWNTVTFDRNNGPLMNAEKHFTAASDESAGLYFASNGDGTCSVSIGVCTDIDVVIPDESPDGDVVTAIADEGFAFRESLSSVVIPDTVTSIGDGAFSCCYNLLDATIPDSVTEIGEDAFYDCDSLLSIFVPSAVTSIGSGAFSNCAAIDSIDVAAGNPSYVSVDGVLFSIDGTALLCFPGGKSGPYVAAHTVTDVDACAFHGCAGLTSLELPNTLTQICSEMFVDCESLSSVTIPHTVTDIGIDAFSGCTDLIDVFFFGTQAQWNAVTIGTGNDPLLAANLHVGSAEDDETGLLFESNGDGTCFVSDYCDCVDSDVVIPALGPCGDAVTAIGSEAFHGRSYITSVVIPEGVTAIGDGAFSDCYNLLDVTIPDSVTEIGDNAFFLCTSLESVIGAEGVTTIGAFAFESCIALSDVTLPEGLETIGIGAFTACESLTELDIPESVTVIEAVAFAGCGFTEITLPSGLTTLPSALFYNCTSLQNIYVAPGSELLTSVDGVLYTKHMTVLLAYPVGRDPAFCTIPASVMEIATGAFYTCDSLTDVYFLGTQEQWDAVSISYDNGGLSAATVHFVVPGDADGSGAANAGDLTALSRHIARIEMLTTATLGAADFDNSGTVDASDLTALARKLARIG